MDSVWDSVRDSVWASVSASVYGQHDAGWLSFYDYFRTNGLTEQTEKLRGLTALAQSAGWALPHANICWVSERHNILTRDARGLLHNVAGPAVAYPDGWSIYAIHGVRIPAEWVEQRATIDPSLVLTHRNVEQRRALAELLGWDRVLQQLNAKEVHRDEFGVLLEAELPDAGKTRFVRVVCGTGRTFALPVDSKTKTAREAVARTYRLSPEEYQPEVRT
jgi:hypothetical protein